MKNLRPIFIVSPKTIKFFEIFSPIDIGAITLFLLVISKYDLDEAVKDHETIHFQQYLELGVVGFLFLYLYFWVKNIILGMSPSESYMAIPFEKEAYDKMYDKDYLKNRKRYSWINYL